jgi:hypothetical protein
MYPIFRVGRSFALSQAEKQSIKAARRENEKKQGKGRYSRKKQIVFDMDDTIPELLAV